MITWVGVWKRDESIVFIQKRTGKVDAPTVDADALAHALGNLPLALEQAASYIDKKKTSLSEYLTFFNSRRKALWKREMAPAEYPGTVATTWTIAFDEIDGSRLAREILLLCSVTAPDTIPKELVVTALRQIEASQGNEPSEIDPLDLNDAIESLSSYSLITAEKDSFSIHRLVHAVAQDRIGHEETARYRNVIFTVLTAQFPGDGYRNSACWSECEKLLPHAENITEYADSSEGIASLLNRIAGYHHGRAFYGKAEPLYRRATHICEQSLGVSHPNTMTIQKNLAGLLEEMK